MLQSSMACEVYSPLAADAYALYVLLLKGPLTTSRSEGKNSPFLRIGCCLRGWMMRALALVSP